MIIPIIATLGAYIAMEFVAWFSHKYIMHGFLWSLHKSHHVKDKNFFERNDLFFLIFAIPSCLSIIFGSLDGFDYKFYIGLGIALYGLTYFIIHDVFIHQRFKFIKKLDNRYLQGMRRAHRNHHKTIGKHGGESFGLLLFNLKYLTNKK